MCYGQSSVFHNNNIINRYKDIYEITNDENDYTSKENVRFFADLRDTSYNFFDMEPKKHCATDSFTNVGDDNEKSAEKFKQCGLA